MNECAWWSFLYFMGEGQERERDWGESKVSQANKTNPPPPGKSQGAVIKNPPPAGKKASGWSRKTPPPAGGEGSGWPRKNPPTLAGKGGAGSRSARARAKPKNTHTAKQMLGLSQDRRRPLLAKN